MMTSLLVYGYCVGVASSRKIEKKTWRTWRSGSSPGRPARPHTHQRVPARPPECLAELFTQVLGLAKKARLVKLGNVALDGTKMKANASKHKAMSYDRMQKDAVRLRQKVQELLAAAEAADAQEDAEFGAGCRGDELPEDLRHAESRLARIKQLKAELEAEARQQDEEAAKHKDDPRPARQRRRCRNTKSPGRKTAASIRKLSAIH